MQGQPIYDGCEPPCGCWELNSGPLEEQAVLLTAEPSPAPDNCCNISGMSTRNSWYEKESQGCKPCWVHCPESTANCTEPCTVLPSAPNPALCCRLHRTLHCQDSIPGLQPEVSLWRPIPLKALLSSSVRLSHTSVKPSAAILF